jgi:hypothetical protein
MFGRGDAPGDFSDGESPRWKQRALYDAIKDAFALSTTSHRVARLSIYDKIEGWELGAALERDVAFEAEALASLVGRRSTSGSL